MKSSRVPADGFKNLGMRRKEGSRHDKRHDEAFKGSLRDIEYSKEAVEGERCWAGATKKGLGKHDFPQLTGWTRHAMKS